VGGPRRGRRCGAIPSPQQTTAAMGARAFAHGGDVFLCPVRVAAISA